MIYRLLDFFRL